MSSYLQEVQDWEKFLEDNYHQFSRRIRAENLLSRLRSFQVFSQEDQETVLNKYCTQFLRAGCLIDIMKTKGRSGFEKFMESVEYEYPEVFLEATGKKPRQDPKKSICVNDRTSCVLMEKMGELVDLSNRQLIAQKQELKKFQGLVAELQTDLDRQVEEQKLKEEQMSQMTETKEKLRQEKKDLEAALEKERQLRKDIEQKYNEHRQRKLDDLYNSSRKTVTRSMAFNPFLEDSKNNISGEKPPKPPKPGNIITGKGLEMPSITGKPSHNVMEELARLQGSNDSLHVCIDEMKKEIDHSRAKQLEAEAEASAVATENEKLKKEMLVLEDQCNLMAEMIKQLKNEINIRKKKESPVEKAILQTTTNLGLTLPLLFNEENRSRANCK